MTRDYVEFPSQMMENWAREPEVIKTFALHYQTDEPIPDSLLNKISEAGTFNEGFETSEYVAAAHLDMAYHTSTENIKDIDKSQDGGPSPRRVFCFLALITPPQGFSADGFINVILRLDTLLLGNDWNFVAIRCCVHKASDVLL